MSWFEEQVYSRKKQDDEVLHNAFKKNIDAVNSSNGKDFVRNSPADTILWHFKIQKEESGEYGSSVEEILSAMDQHGILYRKVTLDDKWYRDAYGPMLTTRLSTGKAVALIPGIVSGYRYYDENQDKWVHINHSCNRDLSKDALCFYNPLPNKKLNVLELVMYCFKTLQTSDIVFIILLMLLTTLLGLLTPKLQYFLMSTVIEQASISLLLSTMVFMAFLSLTVLILSTIHRIFETRIQYKMEISVSAAVMSRLLAFSPSFFRTYSSGEVSTRMNYTCELASNLINNVIFGIIGSLFSLAYITQISSFAPELLIPAIIITLANILFNVISSMVRVRVNRKLMNTNAKENGMLFSLINGIQKIKLAGSEKRAFANWAGVFAEKTKYIYNPPLFLKGNTAFMLLVSLVGNLWICYIAANSRITVAEYYAFNSAYGSLSIAITSLFSIFTLIATIKPTVEMAKPILQTCPEPLIGKKSVKKIRGEIEFSHVCFKYEENMPYVLNDFSLDINPGEYVAIVGPTGCGKSTLVRLLLGFEKPDKGAVYVDKNNLNTLEMTSYRRHIGTVMQDGMLFPGDIYSNIVITSPLLTQEDAWRAAEIAQIAEDIRNMPMGMFTMISEGSGGVSGGQKQRLMIARAVAPCPSVLIMDEATSALDNITQSKVAEALDGLKCTRIIIAHRLSTIKNCDRILYMEGGRIEEEGTYSQLIDQKGKFYELVERQRIGEE